MAFIKLGLFSLFVTLAWANQPTPCAEVFQYEGKKTAGKWDGVLNFNSEFDLHGLWIRVILDKKIDKLEVSIVSDRNTEIQFFYPSHPPLYFRGQKISKLNKNFGVKNIITSKRWGGVLPYFYTGFKVQGLYIENK